VTDVGTKRAEARGNHPAPHGDTPDVTPEPEAPHDLALQRGQTEPCYDVLRLAKSNGLKKMTVALANRLAGTDKNVTFRLACGDAVAYGAILRPP